MKNEGAQTKTRSGLVAALDIGSTKICCMIARPSVDRGPYGGKGPQIVGIGHQISMGLRSGTVIDLRIPDRLIVRKAPKTDKKSNDKGQET